MGDAAGGMGGGPAAKAARMTVAVIAGDPAGVHGLVDQPVLAADQLHIALLPEGIGRFLALGAVPQVNAEEDPPGGQQPARGHHNELSWVISSG